MNLEIAYSKSALSFIDKNQDTLTRDESDTLYCPYLSDRMQGDLIRQDSQTPILVFIRGTAMQQVLITRS